MGENSLGESLFEAAFEHSYNAMVITDADFEGGGPFVRRANPAFCKMTGYTAQEWTGRSPRILQGPGTDRGVIEELSRKIHAGDYFEGHTVNYRKDGAPYHVQWNISPVCDAGGVVVAYISVQQDVSALVEANERNRLLAQQIQCQADRLALELQSAAHYASSILPDGLAGRVEVSSRYLPVRELGGDTFDYLWIDDDHLCVYLIDVSGHGVEPALLSVSVHNLLRSRSMSNETLLAPEAVLSQLNDRFQMDEHAGHYFTMWYGVYEASESTLRYASAGAPPALLFHSANGSEVAVTELPTTSAPVGMFTDTEFSSRTFSVPKGSRILVYSDGASEIALADRRQLRWIDFVDLTTRVASSPDWTLDELLDELNRLAPSGAFEDDCSLIQLAFN